MGFISAESVNGINESNGSLVNPAEADRDGFRSFEVTGLASETPTSTGMREVIVLASWLLVLLRTEEDGRVSFDWTYKGQEEGVKLEPVNSLSSDQIMPSLQSNIRDVATAISRQIENVASRPRPPSSLTLSTSSLSQTSEPQDEVSILSLYPLIWPYKYLTIDERTFCTSKFASIKTISKSDQYGKATIFCLIQ